VNLFRWIPGYTDGIYGQGKEPLLLLFIAYFVTFVLTRLYTRLARMHGWGSGSAGGVHVHHMVPGVILMAVCGALGFSTIYENGVTAGVLAIGFGIGTALTLDEFAMIFHVRDVYWTTEGRASIDAMLMGLALSGLLLVGFAPLDVETQSATSTSEAGLFVTLAVNASVATITFLKKKPIAGTVALLVPAIGCVTALRLAKPGSPWAHWFYEPASAGPRHRSRRERKLERSTERFDQGWPGRFERWFSDIVGGAPSLPAQLEAQGEHEPERRPVEEARQPPRSF
jgi:lysyl-tRNA synthetase class 2